MSDDPIHAMLQKADELGVFPAAAVRARQIASDKGSSASDLERALGLDPILASRVLKVANSSFYGNGRAATLKDAILRIGFHTARDLATALAVANMSDLPQTRQHKMWSHSVRVGVAARRLSRWVGGPGDTMFIAGLMHDFGHMVLLLADAAGYEALLASGSHMGSFTAKEKARYGFDHADLAGRLLSRWNFDPATVRAVTYHHSPAATTGKEAWILAVADYIALLHEARAPMPVIQKTIAATQGEKTLNLDGRLEKILEDYDSDIEEFEKFTSLKG